MGKSRQNTGRDSTSNTKLGRPRSSNTGKRNENSCHTNKFTTATNNNNVNNEQTASEFKLSYYNRSLLNRSNSMPAHFGNAATSDDRNLNENNATKVMTTSNPVDSTDEASGCHGDKDEVPHNLNAYQVHPLVNGEDNQVLLHDYNKAIDRVEHGFSDILR